MSKYFNSFYGLIPLIQFFCFALSGIVVSLTGNISTPYQVLVSLTYLSLILIWVGVGVWRD